MSCVETKATEILGFTPSALWVTLGVLVAVGVIVKLAFDLIIKFKELRKPRVNDEQTIHDQLQSDDERLTVLENTTKKQDQELKLLLRSQMAIIHHMVDGNNTVKLKEAQDDIEEYLISGKIKNREV